jgi:peptidoglycan/xylan/chitin deacetylase (PgdA/CDA1 family)/negative regulator of sigma E activity
MRSSARHRVAILAICVLGCTLGGTLPGSFVPFAGAQTAPQGFPDDPFAWLVSAITAPQRVTYLGMKTVTVWGQGVLRASEVRVYHQAPDRTRLEYLAAGDQPARVVVAAGREQLEYVPGGNRYIRGPAPATDEDAIAKLLPQIRINYAVRFEGTEIVASRHTRIIAIVPKFPGRPRIRIWVDTRTRLILRLERYGPFGALREAESFLTVQLGPIMPGELFNLEPPAGARVQTRRANPAARLTIEEIAHRVGFIPQLPAYLPSGYQLTRSGVTQVNGVPTVTFTFSDGISTLTLFESRGAQAAPPNAKHVRIGGADGAVAPRGVATLVHWNAGEVSFTLVGDLSQDELVRIGASVPPGGTSGRPKEEMEGLDAFPWLGRLAGQMRIASAEAMPVRARGPAPVRSPSSAEEPPGERGQAGVPPVPLSPYITNDTHPIGSGIRSEEELVWNALLARGLTPIVVKVTVASDAVSKLPDGRIARLAWIWFVYGMDWNGDPAAAVEQVRQIARALSFSAFTADPRISVVTLSGFYHRSGWFDGRRTDATFTARLRRTAFLRDPSAMPAGRALASAGDVWYSPDLLSGSLIEHPYLAHDPHYLFGVRHPGPVLPGDRTAESAERFRGSLPEQIWEIKDRLQGLFFGAESRDRFWRGTPERPEIALTFDDGPTPLATPMLLAILRRYGVRATFFVIGVHARAYPYYLKEMAADGDEIADHSYHHPNMTTVDAETMTEEITAGGAVIRRVTGRRPRWFRPPGGDYTSAIVAAARRDGMGFAMWTYNSGDWALPPASVIITRIVSRAEPGAVILLHNGTLNTVRALPELIVELRHRGFTMVTLSRLARDSE